MKEHEELLRLEDLQTCFFTKKGVVRAVDGVDVTIHRGETVGVVGESGCGKSMTAMSVMGLIAKPGRVTGGKILYKGRNIVNDPPKARRRMCGEQISMIFQEPMTSLNPVETVGRQVMEAITIHKNVTREEAKARVLELFAQVGIPDPERRFRAYPHQLSGGLRQRVMIAMAMACEPELLIADEPTTALDVTIEAQILYLMGRMQKEHGTAIMMITHNLGVVAQSCDSVYVMYAGKVVEHTDTKELFKRPLHPYTDGLMRSLPRMTQKDERLYNIRGMVPDLLDLPKGCRFAPRCDRACAQCFEREPELYKAGENHWVRCLMYEKEEERA